uniref:Uncharacterized protein n=1 Tax=Sander lucioperca TaxID=283035 RepID=A0A8D0ADS2_SANLU
GLFPVLQAAMDGPSRLCTCRGYWRMPLLATVHLHGTQTPQIVTNEKGTPCRVQRYLTQDSTSYSSLGAVFLLPAGGAMTKSQYWPVYVLRPGLLLIV